MSGAADRERRGERRRRAAAAVVAVLAAAVVAVAVAPWTGGGTLASAATLWRDARPQVRGEMAAPGCDQGVARLTLRNEGGCPARVVLSVLPVSARAATHLVVRDLTAGPGRVLYDGDLAGGARLDVGELPAGCVRVLRLEAAAPSGTAVAPRLRVAWTAVAGG